MSGSPDAQRRPSAMRRWTDLLLIAGAIIGMLCWSWGTWPDVQIDSGANLYLAWQLSEGNLAYGDFIYLKGPLSMYLNALWFRLFGVSLMSLVLANLALLMALIGLLHRLLREIGGQFSATCACLVLVTMFAFGQLVGVGNYNFLCPYSHEVTHGVLLSVVAIGCFWRFLAQGRRAWLAGAGVALGLVFLAEAHIFLAAALALSVGVGLALGTSHPLRHGILGPLACLIGGALVPLLLTFLLFRLEFPAERALRTTLGSWGFLLQRETYVLPFYQWVTGMAEPAANVKKMAGWCTGSLAVFAPVAALNLILRRPGGYRTGLAAAMAILIASALMSRRMLWDESVRPLPLVMAAIAGASGVMVLRHRADSRRRARALLRVVLSLFALALMGKMLLNVHTYHYGFALAMPATLILVIALVEWVPGAITRLGGYGNGFRAAAVAVVVVIVIAHLKAYAFWFNQKTFLVSSGPDAFVADGRGLLMEAALRDLSRRMGPDETLAVFPEGIMLNYLARRVTPLPYLSLPPFILHTQGEDTVLSTLRAHPPDYIALAHKDTSEEGFQLFGRDYGQRVYAWIRNHYRDVALFGAPPLRDERFGILLMRRSGSLSGSETNGT